MYIFMNGISFLENFDLFNAVFLDADMSVSTLQWLNYCFLEF